MQINHFLLLQKLKNTESTQLWAWALRQIASFFQNKPLKVKFKVKLADFILRGGPRRNLPGPQRRPRSCAGIHRGGARLDWKKNFPTLTELDTFWRCFWVFSRIKNDFFCIFNQVNNQFLHQSYLKSLLPVKLTTKNAVIFL